MSECKVSLYLPVSSCNGVAPQHKVYLRDKPGFGHDKSLAECKSLKHFVIR